MIYFKLINGNEMNVDVDKALMHNPHELIKTNIFLRIHIHIFNVG